MNLEWEEGLEGRGPGHEAESKLGFPRTVDSGDKPMMFQGPWINQPPLIFLFKGAIRLD